MSRKWVRYLLAAAIGLVLGGIVLAGVGYQQRWNPKDPGESARNAIMGTMQRDNFRFETTFMVNIDGRQEVVSRFLGERAEGEKFHFKGNMLQTQAEIFLNGNLFYLWDPVKKLWYTLERGRLDPQDLLLSEISPLAAFDLKTMEDASLIGKDEIKGEKCLLIECKTEVANKLLSAMWHNFQYKLWVDPSDKVIRKAIIEASSRNNINDKLVMTLEFWDFDKKISIEMPVTDKGLN